jgi:hypothetical protein
MEGFEKSRIFPVIADILNLETCCLASWDMPQISQNPELFWLDPLKFQKSCLFYLNRAISRGTRASLNGIISWSVIYQGYLLPTLINVLKAGG